MNLQKIEEATKLLIEGIGDIRPPLEKTPNRVARSFAEMLDGYAVNIPELFFGEDGEGQDQIVVVKNIDFVSICEHHLLPFEGHADIAYLPKDKVIGVSKMARLTNAFAHRLQLQERLTKQLAYCVYDNLKPLGVGVVLKGSHACMRCRGVRSHDATVITSEMLGTFRQEASMRLEILSLLGH